MGNSNAKLLRKKLAKDIEDEIFTINTEIDNMQVKVKKAISKNLKKVNISALRDLRSKTQTLKSNINHMNNCIDRLEKTGWGEREIEIDEDLTVIIHQTNLTSYKNNMEVQKCTDSQN